MGAEPRQPGRDGTAGTAVPPAPVAVAGHDAAGRLALLPWRPALRRAGTALAPLFPEGPARPRSALRAVAVAVGYLAAITLGAWVLLERQAGVRPWNSVWAEDGGIFYRQALLRPVASLLQPYAGYLELVPRLIADVVAALPLRAAAAGFALAGALVAAACAAFVCHVSAGHVRALPLRLLLAASVILLPSALTEISGNGVNTPWYLLFALFWALLWRPRTRRGMAVAFLVCLAAAASNALAIVYLPLMVLRVIALPRVREHAASAGWTAGAALQLITVVRSAGLQHTGLQHSGAAVSMGLSFYLHVVIVPAVAGRHIANVLAAQTSTAVVATAMACIVAAVTGWALIRGDSRARLFVIAAPSLGLALVLVSAIARGWGTAGRVPVVLIGIGDRYAATPVMGIDSLAIVAVDACLRRPGNGIQRAWRAGPALGLAAILAAAWASDFSYVTVRSSNPPWSQLVSGFEQQCDQQPSTTGMVRMPPMKWIRPPPVLPCSLAGADRVSVPRSADAG